MVVVVTGVPVLYVASFGPACGLVRLRNDKSSLTTVAHIYRPIILCSTHGPTMLRAMAGWYSGGPPAYVTHRLEEISQSHCIDERLFDRKMVDWLAASLERKK